MEEGKVDEKGAAAKVVDVEEEDWLLPPPPKAAFKPSAEEDSALRELRYSNWFLFRICIASAFLLSKGHIVSESVLPVHSC